MVIVLAAVLLFFSIVAYRRDGSPQLMVIMMISGLFFVKGLVLSLWIVIDMPEEMPDVLVISLLIDFIILLLLFIAGFRGKKKESKKGKSEPETKESQKESTSKK